MYTQSAQVYLIEMFIATLFKTAKKWKQSKYQSTNERIFENVVYPYNGILFYPQNEWNSDIYHNMDEPQKHYAQWKKPDKDIYFCFNDFFWKRQKVDYWLPRAGVSNGIDCKWAQGFLFRVMKMF